MIDRDEKYVPQCWAYNKDGDRCDMPAGHIEPHMVRRTWGDDECASPIKHQLPDLSTPAAVYPPPPQNLTSGPELDPATGAPIGAMCLVCDHPMHNGMCPVGNSETGCDCRNGVSDR